MTDIRMPPKYQDEGLRAAVELRRRDPSLAVVALSQYVQHDYAAELLDSGDGRGVGYLLKDRVVDVAEFVATLFHRPVHRGEQGRPAGTIAAERGIAITRAYIAAFFDQHLKGGTTPARRPHPMQP